MGLCIELGHSGRCAPIMLYATSFHHITLPCTTIWRDSSRLDNEGFSCPARTRRKPSWSRCGWDDLRSSWLNHSRSIFSPVFDMAFVGLTATGCMTVAGPGGTFHIKAGQPLLHRSDQENVGLCGLRKRSREDEKKESLSEVDIDAAAVEFFVPNNNHIGNTSSMKCIMTCLTLATGM